MRSLKRNFKSFTGTATKGKAGNKDRCLMHGDGLLLQTKQIHIHTNMMSPKSRNQTSTKPPYIHNASLF